MYNVLHFWLKRGVDGFRVDVLWLLIKDDQFRDNPPNPAWQPNQPSIERLLQHYSADRPEVHEVAAEMRAIVDAYPDRVLIGEIYLPVEHLVTYYGSEMRGIHLPFNFQLVFADWNATEIARIVRQYEAALPINGTPNWVLGNHDQKRIASRVGVLGARTAAMLLLTFRGTPTIYYGDELGLENVAIPPDRVQDPWERNEPGSGLGRDPARTPMPWDSSPNARFTAGDPWLPLGPDHDVRNVAVLAAEPRSILNLYRQLIALRRRQPALSVGRLSAVRADKDVLIIERREGDARVLVALNFAHEHRQVELPTDTGHARELLSTHLDRANERVQGRLELRPAEGVILQLL